MKLRPPHTTLRRRSSSTRLSSPFTHNLHYPLIALLAGNGHGSTKLALSLPAYCGPDEGLTMTGIVELAGNGHGSTELALSLPAYCGPDEGLTIAETVGSTEPGVTEIDFRAHELNFLLNKLIHHHYTQPRWRNYE